MGIGVKALGIHMPAEWEPASHPAVLKCAGHEGHRVRASVKGDMW